jgi:hypothetical protein
LIHCTITETVTTSQNEGARWTAEGYGIEVIKADAAFGEGINIGSFVGFAAIAAEFGETKVIG